MKHWFKKDANGNSYLKCVFDVVREAREDMQQDDVLARFKKDVKNTMTFKDSSMSEAYSGGKLGKATAFCVMPFALTTAAVFVPIVVPAAILSVASDEHKKNLDKPKKPNGPDFDKM
ncbi:MAG: hypothetical protein NZ828_09660 [Alphaproteobacteria bacterium]|nr:hypothetical protein [Alphaproteobacteria bacterium]